MYAQDYDGRISLHTGGFGYPTQAESEREWWPHRIQPYVKNMQLLQCPSADVWRLTNECRGYHSWYGGYCGTCNIWQSNFRIDSLEKPAQSVMVFDAPSRECNMAGSGSCWASSYDWEGGGRHNSVANHTFFDGHVKAMKQSSAQSYLNFLTPAGGA